MEGQHHAIQALAPFLGAHNWPLGLLGKQHPKGHSDNSVDPTSRGPEYYSQRFEEVGQQRKPTKRYAKDTEEAIARMQGKWKE